MENLKKLIIILVIFSIIICICVLGMNMKLRNEKNEIIESDITQDFTKEIGLVDDYITFFSVEKMLNNYIKYVASNNEEATYSLLDNTYMQKNKITTENVIGELTNITNYNSNLIIREIYRQENTENKVYYIYCILEKETYFTIYVDVANLSYSIKPINQSEYNQEIKNENKQLERKIIWQNEYNMEISEIPSEKERVSIYFKNFMENALYYPEYAYNLLTAESKQKSFPTIQDFKKYINDKKQLFLSYTVTKIYDDFKDENEYLLYSLKQENSGVNKFQIKMENDYNKYTCIDYEGNNYIFYATSPLKYTVEL